MSDAGSATSNRLTFAYGLLHIVAAWIIGGLLSPDAQEPRSQGELSENAAD